MKEVLELNDTLAELSKTFTYAHNLFTWDADIVILLPWKVH